MKPRGRKPSPLPAPAPTVDIDVLQRALDAIPAPLEPLDAVMLDGFLCALIVRPRRLAPSEWLAHVIDADVRPAPKVFDAKALQSLVVAREEQLRDAISRRAWFDPWIYELDVAPGLEATAVYPWAAGFALALDRFPLPFAADADAVASNEAMALVYRHLDPDDLEDDVDLREAIADLGPVRDLAGAVDDCVRATLLLADVAGLPVVRG